LLKILDVLEEVKRKDSWGRVFGQMLFLMNAAPFRIDSVMDFSWVCGLETTRPYDLFLRSTRGDESLRRDMFLRPVGTYPLKKIWN